MNGTVSLSISVKASIFGWEGSRCCLTKPFGTRFVVSILNSKQNMKCGFKPVKTGRKCLFHLRGEAQQRSQGKTKHDSNHVGLKFNHRLLSPGSSNNSFSEILYTRCRGCRKPHDATIHSIPFHSSNPTMLTQAIPPESSSKFPPRATSGAPARSVQSSPQPARNRLSRTEK